MNESRNGNGPVECAVISPQIAAARASKFSTRYLPGSPETNRFDAFVIGMLRRQTVKAVPRFRQGDCGDEQMRRVLGKQPMKQAGMRPRFPRFADGIRVEHEIHRRTILTKSSGMRAGSQFVVPRTESCHAFNFRIRRTLAVRPFADDVRRRGAIPFVCRRSSQPNNSRACRTDSFLTFLTICSTALTQKR